MEVLVVRHAHAGAKDRWSGDDRLRPLSPRGRIDAQGLVHLLLTLGPRRVVSSPYVRCLQTVAPLVERLGLAVEESPLLAPDAGGRAAELVRALGAEPGRSVVCTHGETIDALQEAFRPTVRGRRDARSGFEPGEPHEKGSVWLLRFRDGRLRDARYVPPPGRRAHRLAQDGAHT